MFLSYVLCLSFTSDQGDPVADCVCQVFMETDTEKSKAWILTGWCASLLAMLV